MLLSITKKTNNKMRVLIPMVEGTLLKSKVEESILQQTIKSEIIKCYAPGSVQRQRYYTEERLINEPIARTKCKEEATKFDGLYAVIQDSDIVHLKITNFEESEKYLNDNPVCGAVSMSKDKVKHRPISCVMFRLTCLKNILFNRSSINNCMCNDVHESIINLGFTFDRLDGNNRIMELI